MQQEILLQIVFEQSESFDTKVLKNNTIQNTPELLEKATMISNLIGELYQAVGNLHNNSSDD